MFEKRTDLALEIHELRGKDSGITIHEHQTDGIHITTAVVNNQEGEKQSGKKIGKYITFDVGEIWKFPPNEFNNSANVIAKELEKLIPKGDGCILVAGLGNEQITPDSIGPRAVKELLVTRHIQSINIDLYQNVGFGCLAAIAPGVLGQTGIESAHIIKSIAQNIKPKCIIIIDALASRRLNRLATTVQISDNGINPGSGVSNKRMPLDKDFLGFPVVSVGVPTVVDAATLAYDLLEEHHGGESEDFVSVIEKILIGNGKNMFVTPKENDIIAEKTANLIATAINIAAHKMSVNQINEFMS